MFTTLLWLSLKSHKLPEEWDTFQKIQKPSTQCRIFLEKKKLSGQSKKISDILVTFHTISKLSRHSWNFPDNMESIQKIWKVYRQPVNFLDNQ